MKSTEKVEIIRYIFSTCDEPHVLACFFMEAFRLTDWFQCRLSAKDAVPQRYPPGIHFQSVDLGKVMELEVTVEVRPFLAALGMIRSLMAHHVRNNRYCGN